MVASLRFLVVYAGAQRLRTPAQPRLPLGPGGLTPSVRWQTPAASEVRARDLEQPRHAVAQPARPRVVALALEVAPVDRLAEDRRLPQGERLVPGEVRDVALRVLRVALSQLVAGREARLRRDRAEQQRVVRHAGLRPARDEVAEVGERVADRRHLPVEDGLEPRRRVAADHDVAEAVVAVDDGGRRALRHRRLELLADLGAVLELARRVDVPQARPAAELALE